MADIPIGYKVVSILAEKCCSRGPSKLVCVKTLVFVLTFISYTCYHASRKPLSVVKTAFTKNCSSDIPPSDIFVNGSNRYTWCDWAPFNQSDSNILLATLDSAFLFAYAGGMFLSGFIADRVSLRYFLALGMIFSGFADYLFGIAETYGIHAFWYFFVIQVFGGLVQTTGWPGVVAVMGNWFGKSKRGLIFGIWNSHTSVGNILGTTIASAFLTTHWGFSFIVPGILIACAGFCVFLFLVESPKDILSDEEMEQHFPTKGDPSSSRDNPEAVAAECSDYDSGQESDCETPLVQPTRLDEENSPGSSAFNKGEKAVGFIGALKIPGVIEFSLCLFFAKLVSYTFLYWLPLYIKASTPLNPTQSSLLSTTFDVGGILGGILAGSFSDYTGMSATTCAIMIVISIPLLSLYNAYGALYLWLNITMLGAVGFFVNGPYALITTAVSAELGTHRSLTGNSKALATVTAIIDGTGSIGAAVGPLLAGIVYKLGWSDVFYMLILSDIFALFMLLRLVSREYKRYSNAPPNRHVQY